MNGIQKNFLKIAFRNINKYKFYACINLFGFAVGIASCLIISLWIKDELSYDRFNKNANDIYRIVMEDNRTDHVTHDHLTPSPLASALKEGFPEVIASSRYFQSSRRGILVKYGENGFYDTVAFGDPSIFNIFTFSFLRGNPEAFFSSPNSAVITEDMAKKYFGNENPIDKILNINYKFNLKVIGIIKNLPLNSQLKFKIFTHFDMLKEVIGKDYESNWGYCSFDTYILLSKNANVNDFNRKIEGILGKNLPGMKKVKLYLQPLTDIHLYALGGGGPIKYVYIFSIIALFILIIACINFTNLSAARAVNRAKEVGLRKVVGADRIQLIKQFLQESVLLAFLAFIAGLLLVMFLLPSFNNFAGKQLKINFFDIDIILYFLILIGFTGILSGIYPALFLSAFQPADVLKGTGRVKSGSMMFRNILVVIQFSLSTMLIISTIFISRQFDYITTKNLGFNKNNLVYIKMNRDLIDKYETVKNELLKNSNILSTTITSNPMGVSVMGSTPDVNWEGKNEEDKVEINAISVGYDFIETFGMKLAAGRDFSREFRSDMTNYIVNEEAVKQMGIQSPIGKQFQLFQPGTIIGVVKDFNFESLHSQVKPLVLAIFPPWHAYMVVKIENVSINGTLDFLRETVKTFAPNYPVAYYFLEEDIKDLYLGEERLKTLVTYFSILSIVVACLGFLGLAAFTAQQKNREIGIRKVLGASIPGIVMLMFKQFSRLIIIATLPAWVAAYFAVNEWLRNFYFRIHTGIDVFIFSSIFMLVITLITVSYQSVKAALTDPVKSLKNQ